MKNQHEITKMSWNQSKQKSDEKQAHYNGPIAELQSIMVVWLHIGVFHHGVRICEGGGDAGPMRVEAGVLSFSI